MLSTTESPHLSGLANPLINSSPLEAEPISLWRQWRTYVTGCSIVTGLLLVGSLSNLPLMLQLLLGGILVLAIYGMIAARFNQMRLGLLLGLAALTLLNLFQGSLGLGFEHNQPAVVWAQSASDDFQQRFSHPEQYHLLMDELFISQTCWQKHSSQLQPLASQPLN